METISKGDVFKDQTNMHQGFKKQMVMVKNTVFFYYTPY